MEGSDFCPILIQIVDEKVLKLGNSPQYPYLLQVWTIKGEMIFEKPLA